MAFPPGRERPGFHANNPMNRRHNRLHPDALLRVAAGPYRPETGWGCAMNVVSFIAGEPISEFPLCSARPLSRMVQVVNDSLAGPDGLLSPRDSLAVIDIGTATIGTAGTPHRDQHAWIADLLDSRRGVAEAVGGEEADLIRATARLHRRQCEHADVTPEQWRAIQCWAGSLPWHGDDLAFLAVDAAAYSAQRDFERAAGRAAAAAVKRAPGLAAVQYLADAVDRWPTKRSTPEIGVTIPSEWNDVTRVTTS